MLTLLAAAGATEPALADFTEVPPRLPGGWPLEALGPQLFAEPAVLTDEERQLLLRWYAESLAHTEAFFGPDIGPPPLVYVCVTPWCARALSGPSGRSYTAITPQPRLVINGIGPLTRGTMTHERAHLEIYRRIWVRWPSLPAWFEEGVATWIGDNVVCPPGTPLAIDDLGRLHDREAWIAFTNPSHVIGPAYCQARAEVAMWAQEHDPGAVLDLVDAVAAGEDFEARYGPIRTAVSRAPRRVLDLRFEDPPGLTARDHSGWTGPAVVQGEVTWTEGRRGAGVEVGPAGRVVLGGLTDLGVPDGPFTLTLWVRPRPGAQGVLVQGSDRPDADGWCASLLGVDGAGRLVAQVPHANRPDAFVTAVGPTLPPERWSHVAVTWDGHVHLAVDGEVSSSTEATKRRAGPGGPMFLLVGGDGGALCFTAGIPAGAWSGDVDEIRVYDGALPTTGSTRPRGRARKGA